MVKKMEKLQFEEVKNNLKYDLHELFDDYINDIRITILNDEDIIIVINDDVDDLYNYMRMTKTEFNARNIEDLNKTINALIYYAY